MPAVALSDGGYCIQELQQFAKAIRGGFNSAQKVRLGLVLFFFHQSVMIEPLHRLAIHGVQWRQLDRFGLGERGRFLSLISRCLRMRPARAVNHGAPGTWNTRVYQLSDCARCDVGTLTFTSNPPRLSDRSRSSVPPYAATRSEAMARPRPVPSFFMSSRCPGKRAC